MQRLDLIRKQLVDYRVQPYILSDYWGHSLILCRANVIFFAKSGETTVMAYDEPQLPDVSTISYSRISASTEVSAYEAYQVHYLEVRP